jgi:Rieske 2Fe-2S family protein
MKNADGALADARSLAAILIARRKRGYALEAPFYVSQEIFDLDMDAIWARHWLNVGAEADVPEPGDFVTIDVGKYSVVIVRGEDGQIRAFHNVCRHRGARIMNIAKGSTAKIVCKYHHWTYDFTGALRFAEHMAHEVDRGCLGLKPVHLKNIAGVLFICLSDNPPPDIDEMQKTVEPYLLPHDLRNTKVAQQVDVVMQGNWKLAMENNRECYHCSGHPELLKIFFQFFGHAEADVKPRQRAYYERYCRISGEMHDIWNALALPWKVVEQLEDRPTAFRLERMPLDNAGESYTADTRAASKRLLGTFPTPRLGVLSLHTQPNSWNHFLADHAVVFNLLPLTPMTTLLRTKWLVHKDAVEGRDYDLQTLTQVWRKTNDQDATFVGWNQSGVQNPAYEPGPYSPNENQVEKFIDWYIGRLDDYVGVRGASLVRLAKPDRKRATAGRPAR